MSVKAKRKKSRVAAPDWHMFQVLRESGNYQVLALLLPEDIEMNDSFDEQTVLFRTIAAEIAARRGDIDQMEKMIAPYIKDIGKVPLSAAARVLLMSASLLQRRDENEAALGQLGRSRNIAAAQSDEELVAETLQCEAEIAASRGLLEEAIESFQEAIDRYSIQKRLYRIGLCYLGRGRALIRIGEAEKARRALETAVRLLLSDSADNLSLACARMSFAEAVSVFGECELALEQLEAARQTFEELEDIDKKLLTQAAIIDTLVRESRVDQAAEYLKQVTVDPSTSRESLIRFHQAEAGVYAALGQWKQAEKSALGAVEISKRSDDPLGRAGARRILGEIYLSLWLDADALCEFRGAAVYARQARHLLVELEIKLLLSQALYLINKTESARLISEVEHEIAGCGLLQLEDACTRARTRNDAHRAEHFYALTGETMRTLKESNRRLLGWMVSRALQLSEGNVPNAARVLKTSPSYLHTLIKRLRRGASVSKRAELKENR